jgi:hypothetical protein
MSGDMTGDEYVAWGKQVHAKRAKLVAKRTYRPERNINVQHDPVLLAMQAVLDGEVLNLHTRVVDARCGMSADFQHLGADIEIRKPHALPQRQQFVPLMDCPDSVSGPMRQQINTGRYPTLEEHLTKTSPAWTVFVNEFTEDDFGGYRYEPYVPGTQEDRPCQT